MEDLIAELKSRKAKGTLKADDPFFKGDVAPIGMAGVEQAESTLGFKLPDLLRRIYSEVANGGFGYAYGLLGLRGGLLNEDGQDAVGLYLAYREPDPDDLQWHWPPGLLPIGHLGCAMFHCVQCTDPTGPVIWFEPNPHERGESWDSSFIPFAPSLPAYFQAWLDGKDLFAEFADDT